MSSSHVHNNSEASSQTRALSSLIMYMFLQNSVREIFEEYAVDTTEMLHDLREATAQNDVDRLFRIMTQILELGEETNVDENTDGVEMDDYEIDGDEDENIYDDSESEIEIEIGNSAGGFIFHRLDRRLFFRLVNLFGDVEEPDVEEPPAPMASDEIENLEKVMVNQKMLDQISNCPICLDIFKKDEEVNILHCEHFYHCICISNWLKIQATCPICRGNP